MKKLPFLIFVFLLMACGGEVPATSDPTAQLPTTAPVVVVDATATILPVATAVPAIVPTVQPTAVATIAADPPTAPPTAMPEASPIPPSPTPEPASLVTAGRTSDGAFFYGNPDAPVTLIDFSDFL